MFNTKLQPEKASNKTLFKEKKVKSLKQESLMSHKKLITQKKMQLPSLC